MQLSDLAATLLAREVATLEGDTDAARVLTTLARAQRYTLDVPNAQYRNLEQGARETAQRQVNG